MSYMLKENGSERRRLLDDECTLQTTPVADAQSQNKDYVVYKERWYILILFSVTALLYLCTWNTWGPIENTASIVLQWGPGQFALLANWGPFSFLPSALLFSWLLHAKGLRVSLLVSGGLLVMGCGIRCIPAPVCMMKWTMNIGHIFIGLSGPVLMSAVTAISATWFPTNERTTATAIAATAPYIGLAGSFIIGPLIVTEIHSPTTGSPLTTSGNHSDEYYIDEDEIQKHLQEIRNLMYIEFGVIAAVYLLTLVRFPAKPLTPPSASAVREREDMKAGIIALLKKVSFWIPALAYACITGVFYGWTAQLGAIFGDKVSQTSSGWMGFYTNLASLVGGAITGRFADHFAGKMKPILLFLILISSFCLTWAILIVNEYINFNLDCLYAAVVLFGLFLNSTIPLFLEITVEGAFPIGEETTTILMTMLNNVTTLGFLILPMIPSIVDFAWLNWVMLGSVVICIPLMAFYKEHYNRLHFDARHPVNDSNLQEK
ncbi:solute carrier family 49 member 4 homolog [Lytechinus variegatus]|uniref:solute carrier family 49 member 4 homolog n=1 Tax=Lytechinus variegatus TaxID=7654 RepID=UPI001BB1D21E|nr:solute carrier family 49 member 4 homolog [Lytechinus variegatus]